MTQQSRKGRKTSQCLAAKEGGDLAAKADMALHLFTFFMLCFIQAQHLYSPVIGPLYS